MAIANLPKTFLFLIWVFCSSANAYFAEPKGGTVPQAVKEAFAEAHPEAKRVVMRSRMDQGELSYEVEYVDADGKNRKILYTLLGGVIRHEEQIALSALPATVLAKIKASYPAARLDKASKIFDTRDALTGYNLVVLGGGKTINLEVDSGGQILKATTD